MADSTLTRPPEPQVSPSVVDLGWGAGGRAGTPDGPDRAVAAGTHTQLDLSTPAPAHPDRRTESDRTERLRAEPGDPGRPPDIPDYTVEGVIGRGAMGAVYRARHRTMRVARAVKVVFLQGRDHGAVRARYAREVRALARVDHPNVVPIHETGECPDGCPYFVMKLAPGGSLAGHLRRFAGDPRACAALVAKVARGVQALHDHNIIHRDIKPLNILLGDRDEPLVADFGLVRFLEDPGGDEPPGGGDPADAPPGQTRTQQTVTGAALGTRYYMAPEQTRGERATCGAGCDIWALGVTLYEMLAGRRPFADDGPTGLFHRIQTADPPPLPAGVPAPLGRIVRRCLRKCPGDRYASAADLAADLERWLNPRWWRLAAGAAVTLAVFAAVAAVHGPGPPADGDPAGPDTRTAVNLTDGKGNLLVATSFPRPNYKLVPQDGPGFTSFSSLTKGFLRLSAEPLAPPARFEGEIDVTFFGKAVDSNPKMVSYGGIFVGEQVWGARNLEHRSAIQLVLNEEKGTERVWNATARVELSRWGAGGAGTSGLGTNPLSRPHGAGQPAQVFIPFQIDVYPDEVRVEVDGVPFPPFSGAAVRGRLRGDATNHRLLGQFRYAEQPFGLGVGLTVNHASLIARNLRLTKLAP